MSKITELARDMACMARTEWCNRDPATSCWCHLNDLFAGHGMGKKSHDALGFIACSSCHDVVDGRAKGLSKEQKRAISYEAMARTWAYLIDSGLVEINVKRK